MVALVVGGIVILLVHRIVDVVATGAHQLESMQIDRDRVVNGRRWLRAALGSALPPTEAEPFVGTPVTLAVTVATREGRGWFHHERLRLGLVDSAFVAESTSGRQIVLSSDVGAAAFDYFLEIGVVGRWVRAWTSVTTSPKVIRIRLLHSHRADVDTAIYLVRDRL